jgi:hypothetical protein
LSLKNIDFCKVLKGAKALPLLKMAMDAYSSVIDVSLLCTTTGQINYNNWTFSDSPVSFQTNEKIQNFIVIYF